MKFSLVFDGELGPNGSAKKKWIIRRHFHPQLKEAWRVNPSLAEALQMRYVPTGSYSHQETHHSVSRADQRPPKDGQFIDLLEPVEIKGKQFFPLVRNSLGLKCGLKILFLRQDEPGKVYQGGDMDNRIKTLLDSLSVPNKDQFVDDPAADYPLYCLMEDDALITSLAVDTQRLLSRPSGSRTDVHLVIEVDVRVVRPRSYNHNFLGD